MKIQSTDLFKQYFYYGEANVCYVFIFGAHFSDIW